MRDKRREDYAARLSDGRPRCQEEICRYTGSWPRFGQCSRAAVVGDRCRQHDPDAVAKRRAEQDAKWEVEWAKERKRISGASFYAVLEQIAAGHNDPRTLAQETLDKFNSKGS